jgi:hypothetical protein
MREAIFYHGSPYGGLKDFDDVKPPVFFTKDRHVARDYAIGHVAGAQKDPGASGKKDPVVYKVDLDPGKILDFRDPKIKKMYEELREKEIVHVRDDMKWMYRPVDAEGFLMSGSGLPNFATTRMIMSMFKKHGHPYDSILIDEGSQGISLAVMNLKGRTKILDWEKP